MLPPVLDNRGAQVLSTTTHSVSARNNPVKMSHKRKLKQDDLRKAMNEHKKKLGVVKKIDSPLAKYTDAGQLMCILCKSVVRSEAAWTVHLNSKTHKENILLAKQTKLETETASFKRPASPAQGATVNKKIKSILKNPSTSSLPTDFFDSTCKQSSSATIADVEPVSMKVQEENGKENEKNGDALPEGFFDDPIMDAKVRKVEYKSPIEEEWEKFKKEIKEEAAQSAQIIADDQEEATTERQLQEIEEQISHWSRVMALVKRKEQVQATDRKRENSNADLSSGDEADYDEFLDWRVKNSYELRRDYSK